METSLTLLQSIKRKDDRESWGLLNQIYAPMIRRWLQKSNVKLDDEDDVLQEVFVTVMEKIESFDRGKQIGSFRSWLKKITINCFRNFYRKKGNQREAAGGTDIGHFIQELEDPQSILSRSWDEEHERSVFQYLIKVVEPSFSENTWKAFFETAIQGRSTGDVARELETSVAAIHTSKARVLAEMRRVGKGLLEEDE